MQAKLDIVLAGSASDALNVVETALRTHDGYTLTRRPTVDDATFLQDTHVDVVLLCIGENWQAELNALPDDDGGPALIVVGPADMQAMRSAMRRGARDYFAQPVQLEELRASLAAFAQRPVTKSTRRSPQVTAFINAAGGSGASFIAENVAHIMAAQQKQHVALLDLDFQFGSQALNLDLPLHYGLSEVLAMVKKLDAVAIQGYFSRHRSGLHVLGEKLDDVILPGDIPADDVERLLNLAGDAFDHTVIDLPRQIDTLFATVAANANRVVLVMQQTLAHVRDTKRLLTILLEEFQIPRERIFVVLNRFDDNHAITVRDIEQTIDHKPVVVLPNDYQRAVKATEVAKPFVDYAPAAPLAKSLAKIAEMVGGRATVTQGNERPLLKRAFASILGGG